MNEPAMSAQSLKIAVRREVLDNGLVLLFLERPQLPTLAVTALFSGSVRYEPNECLGLAQLTGSLLPQGTESRDAVTLADDVDALGAHLSSNVTHDFATVGASSLQSDQEKLLDILAEVLRTPAFAEEEIERKKSDVLSALKRREDDLVYRVRRRVAETLFPGHPYGRTILGTSETVGAITAKEIRAFYESCFRPNNAVIAVVGSFEADTLRDQIAARFGDWDSGSTKLGPVEEVVPRSDPIIETLQKDEVAQATVRLSSLAVPRNHPDYVPMQLMNFVLGGSGFGSRLMTNLREEKGLTYGAASGFVLRKHAGYFSAGFQTGIATMNEAIREMKHEVGRMRDGGVTPAELEWAKRYFTGSVPLSFETNGQLASHVLEQELYELPEEFWIAELEALQSCPIEEVNRVAKEYLRVDEMHLVALVDFRGNELSL